MRIKVNLHCQSRVSLPIDYNYTLYLAIRRLLFDFLKDKKRKLYTKYKRAMPDFTFSQLLIPRRRIEYGLIVIEGGFCSLQLSSLTQDFMEVLIQAFHYHNEVKLFSNSFAIKKVEVLTEPEISADMKFKMLSPLLLVTQKNEKPYFLRPEDEDLAKFFSAHLVGKYELRTGRSMTPSNIHFSLDQDYMENRRSLTKLITIKTINYKTIFCPFRLQGNEELIRFAYDNGIGDKTHYGLGMIEAI